MGIPSNLRCERDKLRQQATGGRMWWGIRIAITAGLLNGPLVKAVQSLGGWGFVVFLGILAAALLLWRASAWLYESERQRIERKAGSGFYAGWRGAIPMVFAGAGFVLGIRPNLFIQATVMPFVIFVILVFVMEQTLAAKRASFDLLEAREQALRAKLAPHFIFNTLNTLHAQIDQDPRGAQATTERLAQLFRQVIEASDQVTIPLKQELAFVEAYLGIEQARLGDRLPVSIEIPEELESADVPPLSLQVLVENAIKHGVAPLERGGEVRIGAERQDGVLHLWVEDPGTGFSELKGTGTALETLRLRLERPEDLEMGMVGGQHRVSFRWRQT
jgi:two-component sensor histidine kinase